MHLLTDLGYHQGEEVPSGDLAKSVNANPSFVRRILAKLSKAGLVHATTGRNGACSLGQKAQQITLLDIYNAVEAPHAFSIHHYAEQKQCAVSCQIKTSMQKVLDKTQRSFETTLRHVRLKTVIDDIKQQNV